MKNNREIIKELHVRLAARLQAARDEAPGVSWLAAQAGDANYLFPLAQAGEIFPLTSVQLVPYTNSWFLGVMNLRGGLYGVVDFPAFVAMSQNAPEKQQPMAVAESSVLTFNAATELNSALRLDRLAGLRGPEAFAESFVSEAGAPVYFGNIYVDFDGLRWQEIDLQMLSQYPSFLNINA